MNRFKNEARVGDAVRLYWEDKAIFILIRGPFCFAWREG